MRLLSLLLLASPSWSLVRSIVPQSAPLSPVVGFAAPTLAPALIEPGPMGLEVLQAISAPIAASAVTPPSVAASVTIEAAPAAAAVVAQTEKPEKIPVVGDLRRMVKEAAAPQAQSGMGSWNAAARSWDKIERKDSTEAKVEQRELVLVVRARRAQAASGLQKAERPVVDYREGVFGAERARAFAEKTFDLGGAKPWTGRELLQALMTVEGLIPARPPDKARADLDRFGVSEQALHALAVREGVTVFRLYDVIEQAYREGLVARIDSERLKRTFYAVPEPVRALLGLAVPAAVPVVPAAAQTQASKELAKFANRMVAAARAVEGLSEKDELFEFTAQVAQAAVEAGLLPVSALPEGFRAKARNLAFETPPLDGAIATLLDSAEGTLYAQVARNLAYEAERAGLYSPTKP